jgi:hypothetical protein
MNDPAASSGVSSSLLIRHSVLDTESSRVFWIPAFAGMTNSPQAAGNTTRRDSKFQCSNVQNGNPALHPFGHLNLDHWILPFDMAQGGELVEPFRISDFQLLRSFRGT